MPKRGDCKECKTGSKYGWCDKCTDTVVKMFVTEAIPFFHTSALNLISCTNTFNKNSTGVSFKLSPYSFEKHSAQWYGPCKSNTWRAIKQTFT